jgi:hypothetical protein
MMALILCASAVHAIPPNQKDTDVDFVTTTSETFVLVPNTSVTVNNDVTRNCIIQFNAEAASSDNDGTMVAHKVDAAPCTAVGGPVLFQSDTVSGGAAHTATWVRHIGAGLNTIRVCYALEDGANNQNSDGGTAQLRRRSLTVECRTQ